MHTREIATDSAMLWETEVIYLTMAMYLAGLVLLLIRRVKPARYILSAAAIPGLLLLAYYVYAFLSDDFSLEAVYQSSSTGLPFLYKLAASWTSAQIHRRYSFIAVSAVRRSKSWM